MNLLKISKPLIIKREPKSNKIHLIVYCIGLFYFPICTFSQNINTPENFPDENFRRCIEVQMGIKTGEAFTEDQALKLQSIDCSNRNIQSLKGIEYFKNLTKLYCMENSITKLDLSANTELRTVNLNTCWLTEIKINQCVYLKELNCAQNSLKKIDLQNNQNLEYLDCSANDLDELHLENNNSIKDLRCSLNSLMELNINQLKDLEYLDCSSNKIENLNVSENKKLNTIYCHGNQLRYLFIPTLPSLSKLYCSSNQLEKIEFENNQSFSLQTLNFRNSDVRSINLDAPNLERLDCARNKSFQFENIQAPSLKYLIVFYCNLQNLNVQLYPQLIYLDCAVNQIVDLDLSGNPKLDTLFCNENNIKDLDISKNPLLRWVTCRYNNIESIHEFTKLDHIQHLDMRYNLLDCDDWEDIQFLYKKIGEPQEPVWNDKPGVFWPGFYFSPQKNKSLNRCSGIESWRLYN